MTAKPRPLIAGNWKMHGHKGGARELRALVKRVGAAGRLKPEVLICPPAVLLGGYRGLVKGSRVKLGGQDCHPHESGAHTGDTSAEALAACGAKYVIVGHSERRADHGEDDKTVRAKAEAAHRAGLTAIVCVGESQAQRDRGQARRVVGAQLKGSLPAGMTPGDTVVAYEPVWAIGTGRTATEAEIADIHDFIRGKLLAATGGEGAKVRILYGGSVKAANAAGILGLANVNGALVGSASLKVADFWPIIAAS